MSLSYKKVQSVSKQVATKGPDLTETVLRVMKKISDIVGSTLGPGGNQVLIERQEHDFPPVVTKDGVTVFRALGFDNAIEQCIMEAARDASVRTASEAGDGTTTATVIAEALTRLTNAFCKENPKVSPQKVVRQLENCFKEVIEPTIRKESIPADLSTPEKRALLWTVAKSSANGDTDLADAVLSCFDLTGDDGNVTISELSGPSKYEVEHIDGYPIPNMGFEDSCIKFSPMFVNDPGNQKVHLQNPIFICYHGRITTVQEVQLVLERIGEIWQRDGGRFNIVIVATGFADDVIATFGMNMQDQRMLNIFPLLVPMFPTPNGQLGFLEDICAYTGAKMLDPLNKPLNSAEYSDFGQAAQTFEATRFTSLILPDESAGNELNLISQVKLLKQQLKEPSSELEKSYLEERIGKLTGGIARLKVIGSSRGELREKRDRAEDAVCAVRGAIRFGCLPGGGWTLLKLMQELTAKYGKDAVVESVLNKALMAPVSRLLANCGLDSDESKKIIQKLSVGVSEGDKTIYDALEGVFINALEGGVLDSSPAVLEAIRNSLSIASLLGTLGGAVVFKRDHEFERAEGQANASFIRDIEDGIKLNKNR